MRIALLIILAMLALSGCRDPDDTWQDPNQLNCGESSDGG